MELIGTKIKGIYRDILVRPDNRIIFDRGWANNTIVEGYRTILARFMNNDPALIKGIQSLAVGQGRVEWDTTGAPAPDPGTTADLENRYSIPITISNPPAECSLEFKYLDASGNVTTSITNRLQITAKLGPGFPAPPDPEGTTYPLREFGLFGTVGNANYMINCIRHPVIHKDVNATLFRIIRLYF